MLQGRDSKDEADSVNDIWFATAIKTCDSIELRVKSTDRRADGVRLETL